LAFCNASLINGHSRYEIYKKYDIPFTTFELIAGHRRVQAAKEIGWSEIEGNVANVSDVGALMLALKTNLMREDMSDIEQGRVLSTVKKETKLTEQEIAKYLGKSLNWVNKRVRVALNLNNEVADALDKGMISFTAAEIISSLDDSLQGNFLLYLSQNNIRDGAGIRKARTRYLNNTIYTIGYETRDLANFIQTLKDNGITRTCTTASSVQVLRLPSDSVSCFNSFISFCLKYCSEKILLWF
jgi:ParB-like partition proteins